MKKLFTTAFVLMIATLASAADIRPINCDMIVSGDAAGSSAHRQLYQMLKDKGYNAASASSYGPGQEDQMLAFGNVLDIEIHYKNEFGTAPDSMGVFLGVRSVRDGGTDNVSTAYDVPVQGDDDNNDQKILDMTAKIPSCLLKN